MQSVLAATPDSAHSPFSNRRSAAAMHDKTRYLKKSSIFEQLTDAELAQAQAQCQFREFSRGDVIYFPRDSGDDALLVVKGRVRTYHITGDGKQAILGFVDPGGMFGELSAFNGTARDEYADAIEKCVIVQIPRTLLLDLMSQNADVSRKLTEVFSERVKRVERRLKSLLFGSSRERLFDLLNDLAEQYGVGSPDGVVIAQKISHQDMASIIGATRETVTITLGELQSEGVIEINRRRITICRKEAVPSVV